MRACVCVFTCITNDQGPEPRREGNRRLIIRLIISSYHHIITLVRLAHQDGLVVSAHVRVLGAASRGRAVASFRQDGAWGEQLAARAEARCCKLIRATFQISALVLLLAALPARLRGRAVPVANRLAVFNVIVLLRVATRDPRLVVVLGVDGGHRPEGEGDEGEDEQGDVGAGHHLDSWYVGVGVWMRVVVDASGMCEDVSSVCMYVLLKVI